MVELDADGEKVVKSASSEENMLKNCFSHKTLLY